MAFISPNTIIKNSCYFSNLVSFKIIKSTTYTKVGASWKKEVDRNPSADYASELKLDSVNTTTHNSITSGGGIKCCRTTSDCDEPGVCNCVFGDTSSNPFNEPCEIDNKPDESTITKCSVKVSIKPGNGSTGRCAVNYKEEKKENFKPCSFRAAICSCADFDSMNAKYLMGTITTFMPTSTKINRSFNGVKGANSTYNSPPLPSKGKVATALISPLCYSLGEMTIGGDRPCS